MRVCPACSQRLTGEGWRCEACGNDPDQRQGVALLNPEAAGSEEGFAEEAFETLAELEAGSFWFRARNQLIVWAIETYFPEAHNALEVGCGTGFVAAELQRRLPRLELTASDASARGLAFARRRLGPERPVLQLDARRLPFAEEFDLIGSFDVLEHIDEDRAVLEAIARALRPGGGLVVTVPQHPWLWSANDEYGHHKRRYRRAELLGKLQDAGLEPLRVTSFVSFLLPAMAVSRWRQRRRPERFDPTAEYHCPPWVDAGMERCMGLEIALIRRGLSFPAGGSLLVTARRQ